MGVVLFAGYLATFFASGDVAMLINSVGLVIVISGTLEAVFLNYPVSDLIAALRVARNTYTQNTLTPERVIEMQELVVTTQTKACSPWTISGEDDDFVFKARAAGSSWMASRMKRCAACSSGDVSFRHRRAQQK